MRIANILYRRKKMADSCFSAFQQHYADVLEFLSARYSALPFTEA